jgi:hypothetical protein
MVYNDKPRFLLEGLHMGRNYVLNLKPLMLLSFFTMILMNYLKNLQKHLCIYFKVSTHTFLPFFAFILISYDDL